MIQETIQKIEAQLGQAHLPPEQEAELRALLAELKEEVGKLSATHQEEARSIAGFAQVSAHEAMRSGRNPVLFQHALEGFRASAEGFEATHPRLVHVVNSICTTLANLGI